MHYYSRAGTGHREKSQNKLMPKNIFGSHHRRRNAHTRAHSQTVACIRASHNTTPIQRRLTKSASQKNISSTHCNRVSLRPTQHTQKKYVCLAQAFPSSLCLFLHSPSLPLPSPAQTPMRGCRVSTRCSRMTASPLFMAPPPPGSADSAAAILTLVTAI